ncbi:MAG TPA: hypothetical protein VMO80_14975 [Terriglobales bacterium]|jgi:hypothetical protein|nr:hypothetical protein [Terriglobales bacterium]
MIAKLYDALFGCWHTRYSFPLTVRPGSGKRGSAAAQHGTYVVCLDCGKEFGYDWKEMKVLNSTTVGSKAIPALATKEAV